MSILVLGLGNTIMTDDGFGVGVVEKLALRYHFHGPVQLISGGNLGLDLLPFLAKLGSLLIIDALDMRGEPGQIFRLEGDEVPRAFAGKLSVHQVGLQELLALAELQGHVPRNLVVWGVQPERIGMGTQLTAPVAAAVEPLLANVLEELAGWGIGFEPRDRE